MYVKVVWQSVYPYPLILTCARRYQWVMNVLFWKTFSTLIYLYSYRSSFCTLSRVNVRCARNISFLGCPRHSVVLNIRFERQKYILRGILYKSLLHCCSYQPLIKILKEYLKASSIFSKASSPLQVFYWLFFEKVKKSHMH